MNPTPNPLTPEEQQSLRDCETQIRAILEKYSCDIQGVANLSTGNVVVNCVIVKVRPAPAAEAPAPAPAGGVAAAAGVTDAAAGPSPAVPANPAA